MAMQIAFLAIIAYVAGSRHDDRMSTPRLVEMHQTFCPGVSICGSNQTRDEPWELPEAGLTTCCTECSCRPSCDDSGHCCFPNRTQQFEEQFPQKRHHCLFPSTVQPPVDKRYMYYSYLMMSEVLKTSSDEINSTSVCGDKNVAPWGSLFPVYSPKHKQIYKNAACADIDDVVDGIFWDATILCRTPADTIGSDLSILIEELNSNSFSDVCQVNFIYPGNSEDLQMQRCYLDLVDTCQASDFKIPDVVNISKKDIIDACTSGLLSPYRHTTMYANVFCRICSEDSLFVNSRCPVVSEIGTRSMMYQRFSALLDVNFITTFKTNTNGGTAKYQEACRTQDTKKIDCRRIQCPLGQLHDESGQCRHPNKMWYNRNFQIYIELTAEENLNINDVFQIKFDSVSSILPDLQNPWGNKWIISSILFRDSTESENITQIVVILKNKSSKVYPKIVLSNIRSTINRDWLLKFNNVSTPLKSRFFRYEELGEEHSAYLGTNSKNISVPLYRTVYMLPHEDYTEVLTITKLYLCDRIELTEDDFILSQNKRTLFNKITNTTMFNAEFELISWDTTEGLRARVCINDSGFHRTNKPTFSSGSQTSIYCFFSFWLPLLLKTIRCLFQYS